MSAGLVTALSPEIRTAVVSSLPEISLEDLPPLGELQAIWRDLETRADGSFFTSWAWVGNWLKIVLSNPSIRRPRLLRARRQGLVVGCALMGEGEATGLWRPIRPLVLNQSGDPATDVIYVEYNGLLVDRSDAAGVRRAMWSFLTEIEEFTEGAAIRIAAADEPTFASLATSGLPTRIERLRSCSWIDLTTVPPGLDGYLSSLSANTRQQVRRAIRLAHGDGELTVTPARDLKEAHAYLAELRELHQRAWQERKQQPGAFASAAFCRFVEGLLDHAAPGGPVQLLRIGDKNAVGILLNFLHRGHVFSYQSGFSYSSDNRHKPGLVCHALAAAHYRDCGHAGYHFMAGEARYKESLSNATEQLAWIVLQRGSALRAAEDYLRGLRHRVKAMSSF